MEPNQKNFFLIRRIIAKILDYSLVYTILSLLQINITFLSFVLTFIGYSGLVALFNGATLGKFMCNLQIQTSKRFFERFFSFILREVVFFLFFPFILLALLVSQSALFHDRLCNTQVVAL